VSDRALARLGIVPQRRLELPSYEAVLFALKKGYGIAAISRYVVASELRTSTLQVIPVRGWQVRNLISVLRVRDALLTPSANQFLSLVRQRFAEISRDRANDRRRR